MNLSAEFWGALIGGLILFAWGGAIIGLLIRAAIRYTDYDRVVRPLIYIALAVLLFIVGMSYATTQGGS